MTKSMQTGLGPLAAWSLFVWITRIRNIWTDDELTTSGQVWRFIVALVFVLGGLGIASLLVRRRGAALVGKEPWWVAAFAMASIIYWAARGAQILAADHDAAFKAVHSVLAVVSFVVAGIALQFVKRAHEQRVSPVPVT